MGTWYVTTAHGTAPKSATCEGCGTGYFYVFERTASLSIKRPPWITEEMKERYREHARRALLRALERECGAAPCPQCGLIQQGMVRWARRRRLPRLQFLGIIVTGVGVAIGGAELFSSGIPLSLIAGVTGAGVALLVIRALLVAAHDPNNTPVEERIERGRELELTREGFEGRRMKVDRITQESTFRLA